MVKVLKNSDKGIVENEIDVARSVGAFLCLPPGELVHGVITHRDSTNVWSAYIFNHETRDRAEAGMFIQMTTLELEGSIAIGHDDRMPLESMGTFLWGRLNVLDAGAHDSSIEESFAKGNGEKGINGTAELSAAAAAPESGADKQKVQKLVFASFENKIDCIAKEDAQPVVRSRRPRTNHIEVTEY